MILRATEHWCLHFTLVISATLAVGCSDVETDASRPQLQHEQHGAREQARRAAELLRKLRSQDPRERSVALASLVNPDGGGGYILHSDHSLPPEVDYETAVFFMKRGREIGTPESKATKIIRE